MAKKSPAKRIARLEGMLIGAGFLLKKLQSSYGHDFGEGMDQQVRQCIRDCDGVAWAQVQREAQAAVKEGAA